MVENVEYKVLYKFNFSGLSFYIRYLHHFNPFSQSAKFNFIVKKEKIFER